MIFELHPPRAAGPLRIGATGRRMDRQPYQACGLVFLVKAGEPVQPVPGCGGRAGDGERCCGGGGHGVPALRKDGVHGHSVRWVDGMV